MTSITVPFGVVAAMPTIASDTVNTVVDLSCVEASR